MGRWARITKAGSVAAVVLGAAALLLGAPSARAECPVPGSSLPGCDGPQVFPPPTTPPLPTTTTTQPPPPAPHPDAEVVAQRLFVLLNQERAAHGLATLARRTEIDTIALAHGRRMAERGDIWHNDAYFTPAVHNLLDAQLLGENVAMNNSVEDMHRRLMASPHHRDNILDGRYRQVGIGVGVADNGWLYAAEDFVQPRAGSAPPKTTAAGPTPPAPAVTSTTAPPPSESAPEAPAELALPDPTPMVGAAATVPGIPARHRPTLLALAALCLLAAAARRIALHRPSEPADTALRDPSVGGGRRAVDPIPHRARPQDGGPRGDRGW
jgi:uncharacterized protein YkwD